MFLALLLAAIACFIVFCYRLIYKPRQIYQALRAQSVPGEPFVPIFGQIKELRKHFQADRQMEYQLSLQRKYGDCFLLPIGPVVNLVIMNPDLISDILTKASSNYTKPKLFRAQFGPVAGSINLVIAEGETHTRLREMLNPAFHFVNLKSLVSIMSQETSVVVNRWIKTNENKSFDVQIELHALSLAIVASSSFGMNTTGDLTTRICHLIQEGFNAVYYRTNHFPIFQIPILNQLPILRKQIIDKNAAILRELVKDMIDSRKSGKTQSNCEGNDLLDLLLTAEDRDGNKLSDEHIENETIAFVLAGHETTGTLLTWCVYILLNNPEVFKDCREEVDQVLCGEAPSYEHLQNLPIIDAVVHETLRLYPPVSMVMRECIHEHTIGEGQLRIPVGTGILFNFYNLHRSEKYWREPFKFNYRRWMRNSNGFKPKLGHPFCYLPFSAGARNCIGQNFALLEAKIVVATIVQQLDIDIEPDQKIVPYQRITMKPKYGLQMRVRCRSPSNQT